MGGEGSGRKPGTESVVKKLMGFDQPAPTDNAVVYLPNYSGVQTAALKTSPPLSAGGVTSVFTRTGDVVAASNDYTWAQINKATSDIADITTKSHTSLTDIGTNTHAQIDTAITASTNHIADTTNPHGTTLYQDTLYSTVLVSGANVSGGAFYTTGTYSGANVNATALISGGGYRTTGSYSGADILGTNILATTLLSGANVYSTGIVSGANIYGTTSISGGLFMTNYDHTTSGASIIVGVIMDTNATPPTASTYPQGTIYLKYTA